MNMKQALRKSKTCEICGKREVFDVEEHMCCLDCYKEKIVGKLLKPIIETIKHKISKAQPKAEFIDSQIVVCSDGQKIYIKRYTISCPLCNGSFIRGVEVRENYENYKNYLPNTFVFCTVCVDAFLLKVGFRIEKVAFYAEMNQELRDTYQPCYSFSNMKTHIAVDFIYKEFKHLKRLQVNAIRKLEGLQPVEFFTSSENEIKLRNVCKVIFPKEKIFFNDRKVLGKYELDLYIPDRKLAIEYQGEQHYKFVKHFHKSKDKYKHQVTKDKIKRKLCVEKGIKLIEIRYDEPITKEHIRKRLQETNRDLPC